MQNCEWGSYRKIIFRNLKKNQIKLGLPLLCETKYFELCLFPKAMLLELVFHLITEANEETQLVNIK